MEICALLQPSRNGRNLKGKMALIFPHQVSLWMTSELDLGHLFRDAWEQIVVWFHRCWQWHQWLKSSYRMHPLPSSEMQKHPYFLILPRSSLGTHVIMLLLLSFPQHHTSGRPWNREPFQWYLCFYHQWLRHACYMSHIYYQMISSDRPYHM